MRSYAFFSAILAAGAVAQEVTTGKLGDAATISDNPIGAQYVATFPNSEKNTVRGTVKAQSNPDGKGVHFEISVSGLPAAGGPWAYHLHSTPVPADGNCTGALAHLDPYQRGQPPAAPKCDSANPQTCEVGDLSGKHGAIETTDFSANYVDQYASLKEGIGAFFGNRSIVIHYANSTRITCANFTQLAAGSPLTPLPTASPSAGFSSVIGANGTSISTATPTYSAPSSPSATTTPPADQPESAAIRAGLSAGAVLAAAAAFFL